MTSVAYHPQQHFAHELAKQYGRGMIATNSEKTKQLRSKALYTSRIIKAGALIGDTKTLLSHWDVDATVDENITRVQRDNVFGKASRSRVEDILGDLPAALSERRNRSRQHSSPSSEENSRPAALDRLLYFHSARADRLLHDAVTEILVPMREHGAWWTSTCRISSDPLTKWVEKGKRSAVGLTPRSLRVAQELLSTLRDFGVLAGGRQQEDRSRLLSQSSRLRTSCFI